MPGMAMHGKYRKTPKGCIFGIIGLFCLGLFSMCVCAIATRSENADDIDPGAFVVMIIALGFGILFTIKGYNRLKRNIKDHNIEKM